MQFNLKSVLIFVIIGAVYLHQSEAAPKLALAKKAVVAKAALLKAPHIIAHVAVAKEVKAKAKIAAVKTLAAAKATKIATLSAITAPFRVAKKSIALKIGAVKAVKAAKVAKIAKTAAILKNLQKSPIILPVQVAYPVKPALIAGKPILKPFSAATLPAPLPNFQALFNVAPPTLSQSLAPIQGIISGAQKAIQTAGSGIPILSTLTRSFIPSGSVSASAGAATNAPVYRFVPELNFNNQNDLSVQPQVSFGVPSVVAASQYGVPK